MAESQKLKNPPITEAVIEIRLAEPLSNFDDISPKLIEEFAESYPKKKEIRQFQIQFKNNDTDTSNDMLGYRLEPQDGKYVLQLKKDGLTLSNVGAYVGWDIFVAEFNNIWAKFDNEILESKICRIAVRYINNFTLSKKHEDYYKKWMTVKINDEANIKKSSLAYLIEQDEFKTIVKIDTSENNNDKYEILLDIDAFCEKEFRREEVEGALAKLRGLKNDFFFANIDDEIIKEFDSNAK